MQNDVVRKIKLCQAIRGFVLAKHWDDWLPGLVAVVQGEVDEVRDYRDPVELRMVVAMVVYSYGIQGIPPEAMRLALQGIIRDHCGDSPVEEQLGRVEEFVIAFGCGKWREIRRTGLCRSWDEPWADAITGLAKMFAPAMVRADRWLAGLGIGYPSPPFEPREAFDAAFGRAASLAMWFGTPSVEYQLAGTNPGIKIAATRDGARFEYGEVKRPGSSGRAERLSDDEPQPGRRFVYILPRGSVIEASPPTRGNGPLEEPVVLPEKTRAIVTVRDGQTWLELKPAGGMKLAETGAQTMNPASTGRKHRIPKLIKLHDGETLTLIPSGTFDFLRCPCGWTRRADSANVCAQSHRVVNWPAQDPAVRLDSFIASAVKGSRPSTLEKFVLRQTPTSGGFVQGMYYWHLAQLPSDKGQVRRVDIEWKRCAHGKHYLNDHSPYECDGPIDPQHVHRIAREGYILPGHFEDIPQVGPTYLYTREARLSCAKKQDPRKTPGSRQPVPRVPDGCGNLYEPRAESRYRHWDELEALRSNLKSQLQEKCREAEDDASDDEVADAETEITRLKAQIAECTAKIDQCHEWLDYQELLYDRKGLERAAREQGKTAAQLELSIGRIVAPFQTVFGCPMCGRVPSKSSRPLYVWVRNNTAYNFRHGEFLRRLASVKKKRGRRPASPTETDDGGESPDDDS
jgi:hypothetical protein